MWRLFFQSQWRLLRLTARALWPPANGIARRSLQRGLVVLLLLPLMWLFALYHWLGLALDELLFRGYRRVCVRQPLFVLGVPRSGTTFVHGVLARQPGVTTFATWECYFGLSVTWRRLWRLVARLDRRVGRPLGRLVDRAVSAGTRGFEDTHPVRLDQPEEDFYGLLPTLTCFALIVLFPDSPDLWRMTRLDDDHDERFRTRQLDYYHRLIQRHLHVHGPELAFLSKNASFAGWTASLSERFPDARFIVCLRAPADALSSQLSTLAGPMRSLASDARPEYFAEIMTETFHYYYRHLLDQADRLPADRIVLLATQRIRNQLASTISDALEQLGLKVDPAFRACLARLDEQSRRHASPHWHRLADAGLDRTAISGRFADIHARFDFGEP